MRGERVVERHLIFTERTSTAELQTHTRTHSETSPSCPRHNSNISTDSLCQGPFNWCALVGDVFCLCICAFLIREQAEEAQCPWRDLVSHSFPKFLFEHSWLRSTFWSCKMRWSEVRLRNTLNSQQSPPSLYRALLIKLKIDKLKC